MKKKLTKKGKPILSQAKHSLEFVKEAIALIPNKDDSVLSGTIKVLCFLGKLIPQSNRENSYLEAGFKRETNKQLVSLIENLDLDMFFEERVCDSILKSDHLYEMKLYDPEIGTLILQPTLKDSTIRFSNTFFRSPDFDFDKLFGLVWKACDGYLELNSRKVEYGINEFIYSKFSPIIGEQFGSVKDRIKEFCDKNSSFRKENISRSYLFLGPPGCGKSTLAQKFSSENFKKILKIDADTLYNVLPAEFLVVVNYLKPECIFVDEIDKQNLFWSNWNTGGTILSLLESIKETNPEITLLFTANDIKILPEPMIRPGRIDEIIEFDIPNEQDCKEILLGYIKNKNKDIGSIAKDLVGLSPAHIKEVAIRINSGDKEVVPLIQKMIKYVKIKHEEAKK